MENLPILAPRPETVLADDEALAFVRELHEHPQVWVYVLARVLSRPTPREFINWREGPAKLKLFYVDGAYAIATRAALARLGIGSDLEVLDTKVDEDEASALVKLTFKFTYAGQVHTVASTQWGSCSKRLGMTWGDARKGAVTDGLKKCLAEFGWAADVYSMAPESLSQPMLPDAARAKLVETVKQLALSKGVDVGDLDSMDQPALVSLKRRLQGRESSS
ncbi:MAG: Rad52/Rad22 family DNA repair protein [Nitrososphaerales archaeon]